MHNQPRYKPLAHSDFYPDQRSARPQVDGTIARGQLREDPLLFTGKVNGAEADLFPFAITAADMQRGRERFTIFCTPCHGQTGLGDGMVVSRGYRKPVSLHDEKVRSKPAGFYFDVITRGFGAMPEYAVQIPVKDRWRIVAYLRALQLSQNARLDDVPPEDRRKLEAQP